MSSWVEWGHVVTSSCMGGWTVGYVAESEHNATLNMPLGLVSQEGRTAVGEACAVWGSDGILGLSALPHALPFSLLCLPPRHFLVQILLPHGRMAFRWDAPAHSTQFLAFTSLSIVGLCATDNASVSFSVTVIPMTAEDISVIPHCVPIPWFVIGEDALLIFVKRTT